MRRRVLVVPVLAALVAGGATACSSEQESYCQAVEEHQAALSEVAASREPGAVLDALDVYRDLQDEAPRDIRDEWSQVVTRLEALQQALDDAGVDPASYDPGRTPDGLADDDRRAIEAAARDLGRPETVEAMSGVEQQARDVCGTPLSQ
jgi:hypothetical protein